MADDLFETLRYNVEIDQESLAQQLSQVREQIDLTMGSLAFSSDQIPSATDAATPTQGIFAAPDVSQLSSGLQPAGMAASDQSFLAGMLSSLDQSAETIQLGGRRFNQDMRILGLLSDSRAQGPMGGNVFGPPEMGTLSGFRNAFLPGMGAFDYDTAGMTRGEFEHAAAASFREGIIDFGSE